MTSHIPSSKQEQFPCFRNVCCWKRCRKSSRADRTQQARCARSRSHRRENRPAILSTADQAPPRSRLFDAALIRIQGVLESHGPGRLDSRGRWEARLSDRTGRSAPTATKDSERPARSPRAPGTSLSTSSPEEASSGATTRSIVAWCEPIQPRSLIQSSSARHASGALCSSPEQRSSVIVWGALKLAAPKNIARGAAVQMSSRAPIVRPSSGPAGPRRPGLVDGSKSSCTTFAPVRVSGVTIELSQRNLL